VNEVLIERSNSTIFCCRQQLSEGLQMFAVAKISNSFIEGRDVVANINLILILSMYF
jgi:hypothetical protein